MATKEAHSTTKKRKESNKHICSGCLGEFEPKEIFIGKIPGKEYTTDFCEKCTKDLGVEEVVPYVKPRVRKETAPKTKKGTAPKTKKGTSKSK